MLITTKILITTMCVEKISLVKILAIWHIIYYLVTESELNCFKKNTILIGNDIIIHTSTAIHTCIYIHDRATPQVHTT